MKAYACTFAILAFMSYLSAARAIIPLVGKLYA
jgi:hypothetical protein